MAVSSLTRMSTPIATDNTNPNQGLLMPKLKYRFRLYFENFGVSQPTSEITKQVMTCSRPKVEFADIVLDVYNSKVKLAGKHNWQDMDVEIRDDALGQVQKLVGEQLQKQLDFMEQASASSGIDYKFLTRLEILDGGNGVLAPTVLETWELYGCYISNADYGDLSYAEGDGVVTIKLTIKFDNALQTPTNGGTNSGGSGVGVLVGRTLGDVATG